MLGLGASLLERPSNVLVHRRSLHGPACPSTHTGTYTGRLITARKTFLCPSDPPCINFHRGCPALQRRLWSSKIISTFSQPLVIPGADGCIFSIHSLARFLLPILPPRSHTPHLLSHGPSCRSHIRSPPRFFRYRESGRLTSFSASKRKTAGFRDSYLEKVARRLWSLPSRLLHFWAVELVWSLFVVVQHQPTQLLFTLHDILDRFVTALRLFLVGESSRCLWHHKAS